MNEFELDALNAIKAYPLLFNGYLDFVRNVFFTIGTGYKWFGGKLTYRSSFMEKHEYEPRVFTPFSDSLKNYNTIMTKITEFENYHAQKIIENAELLVECRIDFPHRQHKMYGYYEKIPCDISPIMNVPHDLHHDWVVPVLEAQAMWYQARYFDYGNYPDVKGAKPWPEPYNTIYFKFKADQINIPAIKKHIDASTKIAKKLLEEIEMEDKK